MKDVAKLTKEMQAVIRKNLPGATANELKIFIEEAAEVKQNLADADSRIQRLEDRIEDLVEQLEKKSREIKVLNEELVQHGNLKEKTLDIEKREREMNVSLAAIQMQEAEKRANVIFDLVSLVFKNPVYKKSEVSTEPVKVTHMDSQYNSRTGNYDLIPSDSITSHPKTTETTETLE